MKRRFLSVFLSLFVSFYAYSQTCTLQTLNNVSPGTVQASITMSGFTQEVVAFQWSVHYDPAVLTYLSVGDWYNGVTGVGIQNTSPGHITFVWGEAYSVPINGVLCKIYFNYVGPGCSYLNFADYPTPRLVADQNYNEYTVTYVNGQICGTSTDVEELKNNEPIVNIFPTVANDYINVTYNIPEDGKIKIGLYNIIGDEIYTTQKNFSALTEENETLNVKHLPAGLYFLKYQIETQNIRTTKTQRITISR